MSFDHDAAGEREVSRQQFVDGLFALLFHESEEFGRDCADALLAEFHIGILTLLMSGSPKSALFPDLQHQVVVSRVMEEIIKRTRSFTQDRPEYRMVLLMLAQKLWASATSKITTEFGMWESDKFQERASA